MKQTTLISVNCLHDFIVLRVVSTGGQPPFLERGVEMLEDGHQITEKQYKFLFCVPIMVSPSFIIIINEPASAKRAQINIQQHTINIQFPSETFMTRFASTPNTLPILVFHRNPQRKTTT